MRGERSTFTPVSTDPREKPVPAEWRAAIEGWTVALRAAGRSPETIRTRTDHLRRAARALGGSPWAVTEDQLIEWVGGARWGRETRRSVYASLRGFWSWSMKAGRCRQSPATGLPSVRPEEPCPRPTPESIYRAALDRADRRETLILLLAATAAMRRREIAQVHISDLVDDLLGASLIVHGKGGKTRIVPLEGPVVLALREACLAGGGWAFPGNVDGHLGAQTVGILASRLMPPGWSLHTLRHRCAMLVDEAAGLIVAQKILGHASVATTQRYVPARDGEMRRAIRHAAA